MPTAPPRMFPEWGFVDTLAGLGSINQQSDVIAFAANPYAAMPSLHSMDALIVGLVMASVCRSRVARVLWLVWPAWVCFAVMGTGNHFWLDCVAGFAARDRHGRDPLPPPHSAVRPRAVTPEPSRGTSPRPGRA